MNQLNHPGAPILNILNNDNGIKMHPSVELEKSVWDPGPRHYALAADL